MAKVYEVFSSNGESFAAKVLNIDLVGSVFSKRFEREAQLLEGLKGEKHIISYLDSGVYNTQPFFVMELANGQSLKEKIDSGLSTKEKLEVIATLCPILEKLHKKSVIHRDLKPSNILFKDDIPKLSDFGVAANASNLGVQSTVESSSRLTSTNDIIGTPHYMAPEQAKCALIVIRKIQGDISLDEAKNAIDEIRRSPFTTASDMYSMAVMIYTALTNELPIEDKGDSRESYLDRVVNETPVSIIRRIPDINTPNSFGNIIMRLLDKDPGFRLPRFTLTRLEKEIREYIKKL